MQNDTNKAAQAYQPIKDSSLLSALNELSRSINIVSTYGPNHPAVEQAASKTETALQELFSNRKKLIVGAFNGVMTVDEVTVMATGTLLKSLERRLVRLHITGLKIERGITEIELNELIGLLASQEAEVFQSGLGQAGLSHISSEKTNYQAVHEDQTVANSSDLEGFGGRGVLVLEDDGNGGPGDGDGGNNVHVEQIVAFLKGDIDIDEDGRGVYASFIRMT